MIAVLFLLAAAAVAVLWLLWMIKHHGVGPLLWRWHTGQPLDGRRHTNAGWLHRSHGQRAVLHPTGRASWFQHLPIACRAAIRTGVTLAVLLVAWGLHGHRGVTLAALAVLGAALAVLGVLQAVYRVRIWKHKRNWVHPLEQAITSRTGLPPIDLQVERDRSRVRIELPPTASRDDAELVAQIASTKLAIESPEVTTRLSGRKPYVEITVSDPPPRYLEWPDIAPAAEAAKSDEFLIGLGKRRVPVTASLGSDSPHVGFNMGSGGGKTNLGSFSALQFLHRGDVCAIIDAKLISYPWARGLPNVAYAGTIPEIHSLLVWTGAELERRNAVSLAGLQPSGAIYADVGSRLIFFAEELNFLVPKLKRYWADQCRDDKSLPKRSPALDAIGDVAFAGRQVRMHVFFIGQMLTSAATGSNDSSVRGNIGIACMARYTQQSWSKMTEKPMPPVPTVQGRIQVVTAGSIRETQVPYLHLADDNETVAAAAASWARDYAVSGVFTPCPAGMPGATLVPGVPANGQLPHVPSDLGVVSGTVPVVAGPPGSVTLSEAVAAGLLPMSVAAARKASQRPGFPEPDGQAGTANTYPIDALYTFTARKERALR